MADAHIPEAEVLDRWFARQQAAWWRRWRWFGWTVILLVGLNTLSGMLHFIYMWSQSWFIELPAVQQVPLWLDLALGAMWSIWSRLLAATWDPLQFSSTIYREGVLAATTVLGLSLAASYQVPVELQIARPTAEIEMHFRRRVRQAMWLWIGLLGGGAQFAAAATLSVHALVLFGIWSDHWDLVLLFTHGVPVTLMQVELLVHVLPRLQTLQARVWAVGAVLLGCLALRLLEPVLLFANERNGFGQRLGMLGWYAMLAIPVGASLALVWLLIRHRRLKHAAAP